MKRNLNDTDWQESFQGKDVNLSWETFFSIVSLLSL